MTLTFSLATKRDAPALAALHAAVAERLTRDFGSGRWSSSPSARAILADMRLPKFSRILTARTSDRRIVGVLRLATKKPWAIDTAYFTTVARPLYLTGMAIHPEVQRQGLGRQMLVEAEALARKWPADAIRLDAFDAPAGAGPFYAKCGYREVGRVTYKSNPLVYFEFVFTR